MSRHYLDHASTSPLRPAAAEAMRAWLDSSLAADPSRIHTEGHASRVAVEEAREQVAALLGARGREVVFTSGATEAIAASTWGAVERGETVVCSAVEHSAVRLSAAAFGRALTIGCDRLGRIDVDAVAGAITDDTGLVNVQWGNHEVGTTQPVQAVVEVCRGRGVLVHVDAAQAAGHVPIDFVALGADLMSVSAHKMGGPAGVGALLVRRGLRLRPLLVGGDQERARRAGLENVAAVVGWGAAAEAIRANLADEESTGRRLTERVIQAAEAVDGVEVLGDPVDRVPHIVCLAVDGVEPQAVLLGLDQRGIAAHSGSACASEGLEPSPVLEAMGVDAQRSLRISVGWNTTDADIDALLAALPEVLSGLRALGQSPQ